MDTKLGEDNGNKWVALSAAEISGAVGAVG